MVLKPEVNRKTPIEMAEKLAEKFKNLRLFKKYTRKTLAKMSGVPESTIKHFETTGKVSLVSLLKIAFVLDAVNEFERLFDLPKIETLSDVKKKYDQKIPKRGKI